MARKNDGLLLQINSFTLIMQNPNQITDFLRYAGRNEVAELLLKRFKNPATTTRGATITEIEGWTAQENVTVSRGDIIKTVQEMQQVGVVRFIVGRRKSPSRIEWQIRADDIQDVQKEEQTTPISLVASPEVSTSAEHKVAEQIALVPPIPDFLNHSFYLRSDLAVSFSLPKNLTDAEAKRIAAFIETLPFDLND